MTAVLSEWVRDVVEQRMREHLADPDPDWMSPAPGLRPPATPDQVAELERWMGQPLDPTYAEFLLQGDGMAHFDRSMPVFGWSDWAGGTPPEAGGAFVDLVQGEFCVDCGLAPDVLLAPVSVNSDGSAGILMIPPGAGPGRFMWFGNGDLAFFPTFREIFEYAVDHGRWKDYAAT
ncbi:hypothetical protein ACFWXO_08295 [Kitasatospora sp. NPDC059088]|uniref:hypothetical protein n=1 Tax=Kitasatospora sp. NPDC059088 TaxID=3346722 RepID=UPI0036CB2AD7